MINKIMRMLFLAVATGILILTTGLVAEGVQITLDNENFEVTTVKGSLVDGQQSQLEAQLAQQPWWGEPDRAYEAASMVKSALKFPNSAIIPGSGVVEAPYFIYSISRSEINDSTLFSGYVYIECSEVEHVYCDYTNPYPFVDSNQANKENIFAVVTPQLRQ